MKCISTGYSYMQHFLLSAAARTLSLKAVFSMGEDAAYQAFKMLRWGSTDGDAVCQIGRASCRERVLMPV